MNNKNNSALALPLSFYTYGVGTQPSVANAKIIASKRRATVTSITIIQGGTHITRNSPQEPTHRWKSHRTAWQMNLLLQGLTSFQQKCPAGRIIPKLNFLSLLCTLKAAANKQTNTYGRLSGISFYRILPEHQTRARAQGPDLGRADRPVCVSVQVTSRTKVRDELDQRICRSICLSARLGVCQPSRRWRHSGPLLCLSAAFWPAPTVRVLSLVGDAPDAPSAISRYRFWPTYNERAADCFVAWAPRCGQIDSLLINNRRAVAQKVPAATKVKFAEREFWRCRVGTCDMGAAAIELNGARVAKKQIIFTCLVWKQLFVQWPWLRL